MSHKRPRGQSGPQLVIDDRRTLGNRELRHRGPVTYARTYDEAKWRLFEAMAYRRPPWDVVYVDHDLGDPRPGRTGLDLLRWLHEYGRPDRLPRVVRIITLNAQAMLPMARVADQIMERRNPEG